MKMTSIMANNMKTKANIMANNNKTKATIMENNNKTKASIMANNMAKTLDNSMANKKQKWHVTWQK
jgi:hypothetical protein